MAYIKPLLLTATLLALSATANADIVYKCQSSEGRKVFSSFPCGPNATREEYKNLAPARKVPADLPPRQGELLNGIPTSKAKALVSNADKRNKGKR